LIAGFFISPLTGDNPCAQPIFTPKLKQDLKHPALIFIKIE
jgi:hypothetical protein